MVLKKITRGLLDALYPPICLICGNLSEGKYPHCCGSCFDTFEVIGPSCCELCGEPFGTAQIPHLCLACLKKPPPFSWCRSIYYYRDPMAKALSLFKYGRMIPLQIPLQDSLVSGLRLMRTHPEVDLIIPVPLAFYSRWKRGFNQSCLLAEAVAGELKVKIRTRVLAKTGRRTQVGLTARQRIDNAASSFAEGGTIGSVKGKKVLLFDDVYTTGATVRACARVLRKAGAKDVSVLTLARAEHT